MNLEEKNKSLEKLSLTDLVTGLPNRRAMELIGARQVARRDASGGSVCLALVRVDKFDLIKRRCLLRGSEKLLADLGSVLVATVRNVDYVGRLDGTDFIVLAPDLNGSEAFTLADRLKQTVQTHEFVCGDQAMPVEVSVGFVLSNQDHTLAYAELIEAAEAELLKQYA